MPHGVDILGAKTHIHSTTNAESFTILASSSSKLWSGKRYNFKRP